jgi:tRNA uridine 5-carboxymethylaminomethyl modification enzyme
MGCRVALITFSRDNIGEMSCNPSIGGIGKGHLVREIDALDGIMARAADAAGTQFRMLNSSKGESVRGPRAQVDRKLYKKAVAKALAGYPNLEIIEDEVVGFDGLKFELASGKMVEAKSAIIATGTFLNGLMHVGEEKTKGGRVDEKSSAGIAKSLKRAGFSMIRLKTGTPPRLDGATIDYAGLEVQDSDAEPEAFSFLTGHLGQRMLTTRITHTNARTHEIILANKDRAPLYNGQIRSVGPRYCPSIEDKVVRFAHHAAPCLPGVGRIRYERRLPQRDFDQPAARGPGRVRPFHRGTRECKYPALRVRGRIRRDRRARALADAGVEARRRPVLRRTDKRDQRVRGSGGTRDICRHQRGIVRAEQRTSRS